MYLNHLILRKVQSSLQISAALLRNVTAAARPLPERRFRPLFPLRAAALAEAAAARSAKRGSTSRTSPQSFQRIDVP